MHKEIYIDDSDALQPFEVPLNDAAQLIAASIHESQEGITEAKVRAALVRAIRRGEIKLKRGTLEKFDWPTPAPILDLWEVNDWALANGLLVVTGGAGPMSEYLDREIVIRDDVKELEDNANFSLFHDKRDRLRALRTMYAAGIDPFEPEAPPASATDRADDPSSANVRAELAKALMQVERLKRELAAEREEPDPRHRKTLLRIIGALLDLSALDRTTLPYVAANAINEKLKSMGQREMKSERIAKVVEAARLVSREAIN